MVELLLTLLVLYGLQCTVLLPKGCSLWLRLGGAWRRSAGPGWRLLHPWPSAWSWLEAGLPVVRAGDGLRAIGPTPWLGSDYAGGPGPLLGPDQQVEARGTRVLIDGGPAARGLSPSHAGRIATVLREVGSGGESALERVLASYVEDAGAPFEAERERVAHATRWLAALADVSLMSLFGVLPGLSIWLGGERTLLLFAPAYAGVHLASVVALYLAHRRLLPEDGGDRFETVLTAAFYPPYLMRSAQGLRLRLLGARSDLMAAGVLPEAAVLDRVRQLLHRDPEDRHGARVLEVLGVSRETLFDPPAREDELARSYCPACRTEYRIVSGACTDCGAALAAF